MAARVRAGLAAFGALGVLLVAGCAPQPGTPTTPAPASTSASAPSSASSAPVTEPTSVSAPTSAAGEPTTASATGEAGSGETVTCEYPAASTPARPVDPPPTKDVPASGTVQVTLEMTEGPVSITMDRAAAPCTVNSFVSLASQGYYDDTSCHRLVDQGIYILQCGDPSATGRGGPGYRYPDELDSAVKLPSGPQGSVLYPAGSVAMANAGANTNGSQFFLVWAETPLLPKYNYFGTMDADSLEVVTSIASRGVSGTEAPKPISEAKIQRVSLG